MNAKETEFNPQKRVLVYLIGQYKIRIEGHDEPIILMDPVTGWYKIVQYTNKQISKMKILKEKACLCRYPRPTIIMYKSYNEFLGHAKTNDLTRNGYGIMSKCVNTENT